MNYIANKTDHKFSSSSWREIDLCSSGAFAIQETWEQKAALRHLSAQPFMLRQTSPLGDGGEMTLQSWSD